MKYIKKVSDYAVVGGLGALIMFNLTGCGDSSQNNTQNSSGNAFNEATQKQGAFVVIQEIAPKEYKIVDEYPSSETRIILRDVNGTEKILSQAEIDKLLAEENKKIEAGQSELTNPTGGGLSLGETILASAAGAIIGSWIGSKLFNNSNYDSQRRTTYSNPSTYSRSQSSFSNNKASLTKSSTSSTKSTTTNTKSGFFSKSSSSISTSSSSSSSFGG